MTSILSLLQFKGRQAEAATTRGVNVAVTAGAGSGKTRTLAGRYLSLLEEGYPLRSLVAITFTEKAAREMRTRIRGFIEEWLAAGAVPNRAAWEKAFAELDAARIGTIHSLCAAILRAHPAEAGVDPGFEVLEEGIAAVFQAQALDSALAWAATQPDTASLFGLLSERGLRTVLAGLVNRRLDAAPAFAGGDPLAAWEAALGQAIAAFSDAPDVRAAVDELAALRHGGQLAVVAGDKLAPQIEQALALWAQAEAARAAGEWETALDALFALRRRGLGGRAGKRGPAKEAVRALRERYDETLHPWLGGRSSNDTPPRWALDRQAAQALPALRRLFDHALAEYQRRKDAGQALDFDDLEARAVTLLEGHAGVRARWQSEVSAVLVDEFQDTNDRQRRIVYALSGTTGRESGKLFVVGDAKQSIYRFRNADVTVFRAVQRDVAASGGRHVDLDLTFRAHEPLLAVTNALLQPILGTEDDPSRPYEVPFAPLRAYRPQPEKPVAAPFVEFHLGLGENADEGRRAAATALARRLHQLHGDEGFDWGEVALLFRAATGFAAYEDALEQAGIPFVTVAGRGFYDRPEVRDVLNALAAIADPTDDLALAGLLRSPACGLTDAALYLLRWGGDGRKRPLWEALNGDLAELDLDEEDAQRARRARETIAALHDLTGRAPVAGVLKGFLDRTHYRAILGSVAGGARLRRNVDKLLADAHRSRLVGVGDFLEYVQTLRDVGVREGEAPVEAGGAVQLMTVHKAKGLEFPLVVVADAAHQRRGGAGRLLLDTELGVMVGLSDDKARPVAYRLAALRDAAMDDAEDKRLLYVAATRAREKLLVSGHAKVKRDGRPELRGWLRRLGEVVGLNEVRLPEAPPDPLAVELEWDGGPLACVLHPPVAGDTPGGATHFQKCVAPPAAPAPDLLAPLAPVAAEEADEKTEEREADPPPRVWRIVPRARRPTGPAWVVGTLVHAALRRWRFPDQPGFEEFLRPYALEAGLTDRAEIDGAIGEARRLLARFQAHPLYAEMDTAERHHEVPYSIVVDGQVKNGILDALYRTGGRWTLVEFKTDRVADPVEMAARIHDRKYDEQARTYAQAVAQRLGQPPRTLLVFLNCGRAVHVVPR